MRINSDRGNKKYMHKSVEKQWKTEPNEHEHLPGLKLTTASKCTTIPDPTNG